MRGTPSVRLSGVRTIRYEEVEEKKSTKILKTPTDFECPFLCHGGVVGGGERSISVSENPSCDVSVNWS